MAEPAFDRERFAARLGTAFVARSLDVRRVAASTNDLAWDALAAGGPDGLAVIALEQRAGRGRAGRAWTHAPGLGLALSLGLRAVDAAWAGAVPLAAGLAAAEAAAALGVPARLKWPNDVLAGGRKLAGVLCEMRRLASGDAIVVGLGVNVLQRREDFPEALRDSAVSLALAGSDAGVEDAAAAVCGAFERRLAQLRAGGREGVLAEWSARAAFWGEPVSVRGPAGEVSGIAQRLDASGALVLRLENGAEWTAVAGDLLAGVPEDAR